MLKFTREKKDTAEQEKGREAAAVGPPSQTAHHTSVSTDPYG